MSSNTPKLSFALLLKKDLPSSELADILSIITSNQIGYYLRTSSFSPHQVILLYVQNYESFLLTAEKLPIFKPKIFKRSFQDSYIQSLSEGPYRSFLNIRKTLDPRISELEKSSSFTFAQRKKFSKEEDLRVLSETLFTSEEYLRIFYSLLKGLETQDSLGKRRFFLDYLEEKKILEEIIPLHDDLSNPYKSNSHSKNSLLKGYLGERCAYYFYFLSYLQKWLIIPAIIGLIVTIFNRAFNEDVEESPFESLYSAFMVFWAACFVIFWEKKQNSLNYQWRGFGKSLRGAHNEHKTVLEDSKHIEEQKDPITGEKVFIYPQKKRFLRYFESLMVTLPILALTLGFLMFSLNLRGYVSSDHTFLYYEPIASMAEEGALFDPNSSMANIPVLLHVLVLFFINLYYSSISHWSSKREYHKTLQGEENSLIVKRVVFETFNTFVDLIYLAFIKLDIASVRRELISIYTFDELRRLVTETLIPYIIRKTKEIKQKKSIVKEKNLDVIEEIDQLIDHKLLETSLGKYEAFDDYLEIVINFAYITLFASAFPLAPLLILIFHYLESLSDRYKLLNIYQRPLPERASGIGSWLGVLRIIGVLSVLSNIVLFAFSSEKMSEFFPFLFKIYHVHVKGSLLQANEEKRGLLEADIKNGMGRYVVFIVFVIEHICFVGFWAIKKWADGREDWTGIYRRRKEFKMKLNKGEIKRK